MTPRRELTRRAALLAGAASVAGCASLPGGEDPERESVNSFRLPGVDEDDETRPIISKRLPLRITSSHLRAGVDRVDELMDELPMPLSSRDMPNGYVRQELIDAANDATTAVASARSADSRFLALQSLREARSRAGYAATGWAVASQGRTVADVQTSWQSVRTETDSLRSEHRYLGTDPVRAALVHAQIERRLERILDRNAPPRTEGGPDSLLSVAAWGERVEWGRADVADSRHLNERLIDVLPEDAGSIESTLRRAASEIFTRGRERRASLESDSTGRDSDADWPLQDALRSELKRAPASIEESSGPASAVIDATAWLTALLAYERITERIDDGERFQVESAEDITAARSEAVSALQTALADSERPALARPLLADAAGRVAAADRDLGRYSGDVQFDRLNGPLRRYVIATARARSVPAATRQMLEALGV